MSRVEVRQATPGDAEIVMTLIRELAFYERRPEDVLVTAKEFATALEKDSAKALILYEDDHPAGMVVYCYTYSTWDGELIHMEDLYVRETHRRKGYGMVLWKELAKIAVERGCRNLLWNVLDWNEPAIKFYKTMPCEDRTEKEGWKWYRLDQEGINQLASVDVQFEHNKNVELLYFTFLLTFSKEVSFVCMRC